MSIAGFIAETTVESPGSGVTLAQLRRSVHQEVRGLHSGGLHRRGERGGIQRGRAPDASVVHCRTPGVDARDGVGEQRVYTRKRLCLFHQGDVMRYSLLREFVRMSPGTWDVFRHLRGGHFAWLPASHTKVAAFIRTHWGDGQRNSDEVWSVMQRLMADHRPRGVGRDVFGRLLMERRPARLLPSQYPHADMH